MRARPAERIREEEPARAGDEHADPEALDEDRRARPVLAFVQDLDAVGVQHDILTGGGKGDHAGEQRDDAEVGHRVGEPERDNRRHAGEMGRQHPAPPPAEAAGQPGQPEPVDARRPEEFQPVDGRDKGEQADAGPVYPGLGEARAQHLHGQHQRQAAGEAERQHHGDASAPEGVCRPP